MPKKILVIDAHPDCHSFCNCLAEEYYLSAKDGKYDVQILKIRDLKFDPILHHGYRVSQKLEKDLVKAQKLILWCEHLVLVTPVWWYGLPALAKGFIDRVLLSGFAFHLDKESGQIKRLLKGRSARVIYTQSAPLLISGFYCRDSFWKQIQCGILSFCGFDPVKRTYLTKVHEIKNVIHRQNFLAEVKKLGLRGE